MTGDLYILLAPDLGAVGQSGFHLAVLGILLGSYPGACAPDRLHAGRRALRGDGREPRRRARVLRRGAGVVLEAAAIRRFRSAVRLGVREPILAARAHFGRGHRAWGERVAFTVAWFMEGW